MIVLAGFMGSGKTTVGRRLARGMGVSLVDTDEMVERRSGMSVREIFEGQGEKTFRRLETEAIGMLPKRASAAVSLGGGALGRPRNLRSLRRRGGVIVYLEAPLGVLRTRLRRTQSEARPLWARKGPGGLALLFKNRSRLYEGNADLVVRASGRPAAEVAREVIERVNEISIGKADADKSSSRGKVVRDSRKARSARSAAHSAVSAGGPTRPSHESAGLQAGGAGSSE